MRYAICRNVDWFGLCLRIDVRAIGHSRLGSKCEKSLKRRFNSAVLSTVSVGGISAIDIKSTARAAGVGEPRADVIELDNVGCWGQNINLKL